MDMNVNSHPLNRKLCVCFVFLTDRIKKKKDEGESGETISPIVLRLYR